MASIQNKKFVRRLLFSIKNLQFELKGPAFDSERGHLGGLDVRADQNDRKVDFEYPPPNLSMSNLGHHESPQKFNKQNFPNIVVHPEFNSKGIGWIRYLLSRARL